VSGVVTERCPVTGLPSGRVLDQAVEYFSEIHRHDGWILFVGVDRIEFINERYGRETGDRVLHQVAQLIDGESAMKLYRYDGPVFAGLFTGDIGDALGIAERTRKRVAENSDFVEAVSLSIGMLAVSEVDAAYDLEARAFARLRIARRRGGNQVCASAPDDDDAEYSSGTVLIVDPESGALSVMIRELEASGLTVITAEDGLEALQLVSQIAPELVICEVSVPRIGGLDLRTRLRAMEGLAGVPFILASHRKNDELVRQAVSLGILHYFRKPVSAVEVAAVARHLVRERIRETGCE
jgi:two-component system, cell cycle response regulator